MTSYVTKSNSLRINQVHDNIIESTDVKWTTSHLHPWRPNLPNILSDGKCYVTGIVDWVRQLVYLVALQQRS